MKSRKTSARVGFWAVVCAVAAIMLSAAPCARADVTVEAGTEADIDYAVSGSLFAYGTVNMLPGADIEWFVYTAETTVLNITGGDVGFFIDVVEGAQVTVYGTDFTIGGVAQPLGPVEINGTLRGTYEGGVTNGIDLTFSCWSGATVILAAPGAGDPIPVQIDIKPGTNPNPINPGSNGLIPVAILTTADFDAATVDPGTVALAGRDVAVRGKSDKTMARLEDVDGDGDLDLLLQVDTQSDGALWTAGPVTLEGETFGDAQASGEGQPIGGQAIEGTDDVIIVPE